VVNDASLLVAVFVKTYTLPRFNPLVRNVHPVGVVKVTAPATMATNTLPLDAGVKEHVWVPPPLLLMEVPVSSVRVIHAGMINPVIAY
jgi:hypothetical protein